MIECDEDSADVAGAGVAINALVENCYEMLEEIESAEETIDQAICDAKVEVEQSGRKANA